MGSYLRAKINNLVKIGIRVDASPSIGLGHLIRCLTLAESLRDRGCAVFFLMGATSENLAARNIPRSLGFPVIDLPFVDFWSSFTELESCQEKDATHTRFEIQKLSDKFDWMVVDHYKLSKVWCELAYKFSDKICVIDDIFDRSITCDLLLNQNYYKKAFNPYSNLVAPGTRTLLGPSFCLLKREFIPHRPESPKSLPCDRKLSLLISFGGADPNDLTSKIVSQLELNKYEAHIVIGAMYKHWEILKKIIDKRSDVKVHRNVADIWKLMRTTDLSIGAGGTMTWERFFMGIPSVAISIASNQTQGLSDLAEDNYIVYAGEEPKATEVAVGFLDDLIADKASYYQLSQSGMELIDGLGPARVTEAILG